MCVKQAMREDRTHDPKRDIRLWSKEQRTHRGNEQCIDDVRVLKYDRNNSPDDEECLIGTDQRYRDLPYHYFLGRIGTLHTIRFRKENGCGRNATVFYSIPIDRGIQLRLRPELPARSPFQV